MNVGWICGFILGILAIVSRWINIPWLYYYRFPILAVAFFIVALSGSSNRRY